MYSREIEISGKKYTVRFGAWVMKRLHDDGIGIKDIADKITNNPFGFIPTLIYYGIVNAIPGRDESKVDVDENTLFDWLDCQNGGINSVEVSKLLELFTNQLTDGVPVDNAKKKTVIPKAK